MTRALWMTLITVLLAFHPANAGEAPRQIAGFQLGADIGQYRSMLQTDSALPVRHMEYLTEVELSSPPEGFRSGYIFYGNCDHPGRIVKMKLKYDRSDREFFDQLLQRFKKKFGEPDQYRGDAFRAFIAWKWSFKDQNNQKISLILQHNSADVEEYTDGNSVKLSNTSLIEQECKCFEAKQPMQKRVKSDKGKKSSEPVDFRSLIPE